MSEHHICVPADTLSGSLMAGAWVASNSPNQVERREIVFRAYLQSLLAKVAGHLMLIGQSSTGRPASFMK